MIRAVGYARVSTEDQARTGVSLPAQVHKIRMYAEIHDLQLVGIEVDDASGKTLDRPGVRAALAMLDARTADGLLIVKLDRLTRRIRDLDFLIDRYFGQDRSKQLWSVSDSIDTRTAAGRLVLNVVMSVAQWEREVIAERTRDGLAEKIRTDSRCGKVRFGKVLDPTDPRVSKVAKRPVALIPHPEEAEAIALMRRMRSEGGSFREIAAFLTESKIPTKEGLDRWEHSTVRRILIRNPEVASAQG